MTVTGGGARAERRHSSGVVQGAMQSLTAWLTRPLASFHLLLAVFGLLVVFGLVMVLSASSVDSFRQDGSSYNIFSKQLLYCVVGLALFYLAMRLPVRVLRRYSLPAVIVCLLMLVAVLTPLGARINGAQSWFQIGNFSFQPVEFTKIAFALWGAHVLVTKRGLLRQYRHLLVPVVPGALLISALVMLQPDLGSTITLFVVLLALLWFAGAPLRLFGLVALGGVTGAVVLAMVAEYRVDRLTTFLNPSSDPSDKGYHARQSLLALADGGVLGRGLGQGWSKWQYLPNAHNDFIFAVIGEELGFIGCLVVLFLFGTTAYVGMRIATRNTDPWMRLVSATLTTWMVGQAAINVGYVVGLLPITGLPLPLISSGGSSVVTTMLVFGLLANFARHEPEAIAALRSFGPGRVGKLLRLPTPVPARSATRRRATPTSSPPSRSGVKAGRSPSVRSTARSERETRDSRDARAPRRMLRRASRAVTGQVGRAGRTGAGRPATARGRSTR